MGGVVQRFLLAGCASFFCCLAASRADSVRALTVAELAQAADVVALGSVRSLSCQRDEEGRVFTRVRLDVDETWKGDIDHAEFTIVQAGGVLGARITKPRGQATFKPGERVLIFAALNRRGEGVILGLRQGKFTVRRDEKTGAEVAARASGSAQSVSLETLKNSVSLLSR